MGESNQEISITYVKGDATNPKSGGLKIIVHICNDLGKWGKGFVLAINKRWREPEKVYKDSFSSPPYPELGTVQFINVETGTVVANVIGQHGVRSLRSKTSPPPIRYEAVKQGLETIARYAEKNNASVHMPRIGCGLAGGKWENIEPIIVDALIKRNIRTTVYDFE